jgi:hypothetical protein
VDAQPARPALAVALVHSAPSHPLAHVGI